MKMRYTVEMEDMVKYYQVLISDNSQFACKQRQKLLIILSLAICGCMAISMAFGKHYIDAVVYCLVCCPIIFLGFSRIRLRRKVNTELIQWIYSRGKNKGTFGEHELELLPDDLRDISSANKTTMKFSKIGNIEDTGTHIFIVARSFSVFVIPKAKVSEGDLDAFITTLKDKIQSSGNSQTILSN